MSAPARSVTPAPGSGSRRVQKVTASMVASARAQVEIAHRLGQQVPPAVSKIANITR